MAIEPKRGCGYRKVGGIYLVSDGAGHACHRLPIPLHVCPTCNQGIKQARGFTWVDAETLLSPACEEGVRKCDCPELCSACHPVLLNDETGRAGLLWVGGKFYPKAEDFNREANSLGISKRIAAVPRGFKVGESWVLLAHPTACPVQAVENVGLVETPVNKEGTPGVFRIFRPQRVEKIITESMSKVPEIMEELAKQNLTPVIVPDDDPDHQGSVYDQKENED